MARFNFGQFAGNFVQAFQQAQQFKQQNALQQKEVKLKTKLYELQLQREQMGLDKEQDAAKARDQLLAQMTPQQVPNPVPPLIRAPGQPEMVPGGRGMGLTDLLADPQNAKLLLQSGMIKPDDILAQEGARANRAMVERVMGGGGTAGMELQGVKIGPRGELMPDFGQPQITTQTVDTPDGPRIQSFNPRTGQQVADLGAAKAESITPEQAGRLSGLAQAQGIAADIRRQFIKPDGSIDRALVLTSFGKVPRSKGRSVSNNIAIGIDAVNRARSGAALSKADLSETAAQFTPSPLDSDEGIKIKLDQFDQFVSGTLDFATLPPRIRAILEKAAPKGKGAAQGAGADKVIDFSELPD